MASEARVLPFVQKEEKEQVMYVKFYPYRGRIRRYILHKREFAKRFARVASASCYAGAYALLSPRLRASS